MQQVAPAAGGPQACSLIPRLGVGKTRRKIGHFLGFHQINVGFPFSFFLFFNHQLWNLNGLNGINVGHCGSIWVDYLVCNLNRWDKAWEWDFSINYGVCQENGSSNTTRCLNICVSMHIGDEIHWYIVTGCHGWTPRSAHTFSPWLQPPGGSDTQSLKDVCPSWVWAFIRISCWLVQRARIKNDVFPWFSIWWVGWTSICQRFGCSGSVPGCWPIPRWSQMLLVEHPRL